MSHVITVPDESPSADQTPGAGKVAPPKGPAPAQVPTLLPAPASVPAAGPTPPAGEGPLLTADVQASLVRAARSVNYLDPLSNARLYNDLATVLIVAGLLTAGTYQGLYTGYTGEANRLKFRWFCILNLWSFCLSLLVVFTAVAGIMLIQQTARHTWPDDWQHLPDPPTRMDRKYVKADVYGKVEDCVKALNFIWHANRNGLISPGISTVIQHLFRGVWTMLLLSAVMALLAGCVALQKLLHHHDNQLFWSAAFTAALATIIILVVEYILTFTRGHNVVTAGNYASSATPNAAAPAAAPNTTAPASSSQAPRATNGAGTASIPGTEPGTEPGSEPGTEPGTEPGSEPGTEQTVMERAVKSACFLPSSRTTFNSDVWDHAITIAPISSEERDSISSGLLHALLDEHQKDIQPMMDQLKVWKSQKGPYYAVHMFRDPAHVAVALKYMRALSTFWDKVRGMVKAKTITDDQIFKEIKWLGRAREYRLLAEQLDIVNWYFTDKHVDYRQGTTDDNRHYIGGLSDDAFNRDADGNLILNAKSKATVKDNNCRPGRYRWIQSREVEDRRAANAEERARGLPLSSLQAAVALRAALGDDGTGSPIRFGDYAKWPAAKVAEMKL